MINVFAPGVNWHEAFAAGETILGGWLGAGKQASELESAWANHVKANSDQIVSLHNCTEALFQAVALLTNPGDTVVVPAIHFIGVGNAVLAQGRRLILCDVDPRTLNIDMDKLGWRGGAIILNHYGGIPCDMDKVATGFKMGSVIIEDAACAPVSTFHGKPVGTMGDCGVWSFDAMKVLTTGDGGMVWLRDVEQAERLRRRTRLGLEVKHGINRQDYRWWEFTIPEEHGRLSEMNDIAAAIGLAQLKRLPELVERRREVCIAYDEGLAGLDWLTLRPRCPDDRTDSYYFYWVQCEKRDELAHYLRQNDVYTTFRYWPLHWAYGLGGSYPGAEQAAQTTLLLPCHSMLSDADVDKVISLVRSFQ